MDYRVVPDGQLRDETEEQTQARHQDAMRALKKAQREELADAKRTRVDTDDINRMRSKHKKNVKLLKYTQANELHKKDIAKEESYLGAQDSDTASMSLRDAYTTLGLRPGAERDDIYKARRKKIRDLKRQGADQAKIDRVNQAADTAKRDSDSFFNLDGQRIDGNGEVVETWGEKFNRWIETAKGWFGQDRSTQIAVELAGLNEERDEDQFEAALNELKYQLKRYPGRVDQIANSYLKNVTQANYNEEVIETLQDALPADQEFVREADGKPFEIRQKASYVMVDGPPVDHSV